MKTKQTKWFNSNIIKEDESRTTQNSKHFILNNGTRKAIFSPTAINYFDKTEKKWKPIDNSLKTIETGYQANIGKYTAKISNKSDNETVEISNGSDTLSWEYLGVNKNIFPSVKKATAKAGGKRKANLNIKSEIKDNLNISSASRAIFADAEGNIDLDYLIESNGVKENITIKSKSDNYHYYFLFRVNGFDMNLGAKGKSIEFYKTMTEETEERTPEFIIPSLFMYDANGAYSDNVEYSIEKISDTDYIFSVEADAEWVNSAERVFPVCIDPQVLSINTAPHISA